MNSIATRKVSIINGAGGRLEGARTCAGDARMLARGSRGRLGGIRDLFLAAVFLIGAGPAAATLVTFSFDDTLGMPYNSSSSPGANSLVQTYMRAVWAGASLTGTLNVTGAGELSNNRYTGDNHVVGPFSTCGSNGSTYGCNLIPATLGSTEGGVQGSAVPHTLGTSNPVTDPTSLTDNYIVNNGSDRITVVFPSLVYSVSFDFEIFPDGTCTDDTTRACGGALLPNWPDFKFLADGFQKFQEFATNPGSPGTYCESQSSTPLNNIACDNAPQYLGVSGNWFFPNGVTKLEFVDWPRRIGIDNLVVDTDENCCVTRNSVPEPGSIALIGAALAGLAAVRRRRHAVSV